MKLALLSNDRLSPYINWTTLAPPLFTELAEAHGAEIVSPPRISLTALHEWNEARAAIRKADTIFWMQGSARPEIPVHIASVMKFRLRRSAFVIDAWRPALGRIGLLATAQALDPCFVAFREGQAELQRMFPSGKFEWLPFGVDTDVFQAPVDQSRPIFAFWMGRRHDPIHQALLKYCEQRGLHYEHRQGELLSPAELGEIVGRSKYFVVTPPDLDNPVRTGGFSPLVMRYLEGLSAGCRLLGVLPGSGEYETLLPIEAICQVAPDGVDLADRLDEDRDNSAGWLASARAQDIVRRQHSWKRRAEQIYERLAHDITIRFDND